MSRLRATAATTFRSLRVRNYRLFFTGQLVSVSGTWMQSVAQAWLVVHYLAPHGEAGVDLGIVTALQFLPLLLLGSWGGLVVDRLDKRRLLFATQAAAGTLALVLGVLVTVGDGPPAWPACGRSISSPSASDSSTSSTTRGARPSSSRWSAPPISPTRSA